MKEKIKFLSMVPVLPSAHIARDVAWYEQKTGFKTFFYDKMYAALQRGNLFLHLQWHADTTDDPLLGGSVVRIFVEDINPLFEEFVARGTVHKNKLVKNTPWQTHEFGFHDLNQNAIFMVEDIV